MELIHTCYRIGDIDRSVAFYEALGGVRLAGERREVIGGLEVAEIAYRWRIEDLVRLKGAAR